MFSEINVMVEDGKLGRNLGNSINAQAKIGVSDAKAGAPILITGSMKPDNIKGLLGYTPLADACIDAVENGLETIYAIPVEGEIVGRIGEVMHTGTGEGSLSVEGSPNNAYDIVVRITGSGVNNEGSFRYSIDGGNNFSDERIIPSGGTYGMPGTGLTLVFAAGAEGESFLEGDAYAFSTDAPAMSNAGALNAVEILAGFNKTVEICHIVGASGKALWAALQSEAEEFMGVYKKPLIFLCEGRRCGDAEPLGDYLAAMKAERKDISSRYICVCLSYASYQRKDFRIQDINMAGVISGLIGQAKESLSIGCVEEFPISPEKLLKLLPEGVENYSRELDGIGYTVFRRYDGREEFYVSNANVMSPAGSDFQHVESVRVLNRIVREIIRQATDKVQTEIDPGSVEGSLKAIEAHLNIAMEDCERDKIISSGEAVISTEGIDIFTEEALDVEATWVPMGSVRGFNIKFAVSNPVLSGREQEE